MVCHKNLKNPKISDKLLLDDTIIEVSWEGDILWEWICSDHFNEMGFSEEARNVMARNPAMRHVGEGMGDWMHINSMSTLGPNRWYDAGDERFHPDNIIYSSRDANFVIIISRETGDVVWRVGPDFAGRPEEPLGQFVGQHHPHMIPEGLPGAGNMLVFDNGGSSGYGGTATEGTPNRYTRNYSRVLEFDPVTFEVVWEYGSASGDDRFFSYFVILYSGGWQWGQELPASDELYRTAITGFFASIIICQVADVIICRTRRQSLFTVGVFTNRLVWLGIGTELLLLALIAYVPAFNTFFGTAPLEPWQLLLSVPFALAILAGDELRRVLVRRENPFVLRWLTW